MKQIITLLALVFSLALHAQELKIIKSDIAEVKGLSGYEYIGKYQDEHYVYNWENIIVLNKDFNFKKEIEGLAKLWHLDMRFFGNNIACIAGEKEIMAYDKNGGIAWGEVLKPYKSSGQSGYVSQNPGTYYLVGEDQLFVSSYTGSNLVSINFGGKDITAHYVINCYDIEGNLSWVVPFEKSEEVISNFVLGKDKKYLYALKEKSAIGSKSLIKIDVSTGEIVQTEVINSNKSKILYNSRLILDEENDQLLIIAFKGENETVKELHLKGFLSYVIHLDNLSIINEEEVSFEEAKVLDDFQNTKFVRGDPKTALLSKAGFPRNVEFVDMILNEDGDMILMFEQNYNGCYKYSTNNSMMASPSNTSGTSTSYACEAFHKNIILLKLHNGKIDPTIHFINRSAQSSGSFDSFGEPLLFKQNGKIHVLYVHSDAITPTKNTMEMKISSINEDLTGDIIDKIVLDGFSTYMFELDDSFFDIEKNRVILLGAEKRKNLVVGTIEF